MLASQHTARDFIALGASRLECRWLDASGQVIASRNGQPIATAAVDQQLTLVFLHEGLGSISLWREFPKQLCQATGLPGFIYARQGYGASSPLTAPRRVDYLHHEAAQVLPQVLRLARIDKPVLIGHSDGASIALLHAGLYPSKALALVVLAPHLFVERMTVEAIAEVSTRFHQSDDDRLRAALARHHQDLDSAFGGWADIWLNPEFLAFNIEAEVARIQCPISAIQGLDDPYGSALQVERIAQLCPDTTVHLLPACKHNPHLEQAERTLELCRAFLNRLRRQSP